MVSATGASKLESRTELVVRVHTSPKAARPPATVGSRGASRCGGNRAVAIHTVCWSSIGTGRPLHRCRFMRTRRWSALLPPWQASGPSSRSEATTAGVAMAALQVVVREPDPCRGEPNVTPQDQDGPSRPSGLRAPNARTTLRLPPGSRAQDAAPVGQLCRCASTRLANVCECSEPRVRARQIRTSRRTPPQKCRMILRVRSSPVQAGRSRHRFWASEWEPGCEDSSIRQGTEGELVRGPNRS
jgi:hypothetical protein